MDPSQEPTPLSSHTFESLCDELVSGRGVAIDGEDEVFRLSSPEARSLFDWYRQNHDKWLGQKNRKEDVKALAVKVTQEPPELPARGIPKDSMDARRIHLESMRAHRFAGIHRYGEPDEPPADCVFKFDKPLTLIEGKNGAGKTSLLAAVLWCRTGEVFRSQRPPESAEQSVTLRTGREEGCTPEVETSLDMSPITPMPSADVLASLGDDRLPLDTWVELTFVDDEGNDLGSFRRSMGRSPRGKVAVMEPDFSSLGLTPVALQVGTKMPGLIPYIQLDECSDLGEAVAKLTGFRPFYDLVIHAKKSQSKLRGELRKESEAEVKRLDTEFVQARDELERLILSHSGIKPSLSLPKPDKGETLEATLESLRKHFEDHRSQMLADAQSILGKSFDSDDNELVSDLTDNVGPALGLLDSEHLKKLDSAKRLADLANLDSKELAEAESLIQKLVSEAAELARLAAKPEVAARLRLYARVAEWLKEHRKESGEIERCPVCEAELEGRIDQVTGRGVADHIRECIVAERDFVGKTLQAWEDAALDNLSRVLASPLQAEIDQDLPKRPRDLIRTALTDELFKSNSFALSLAPLKSAAASLCGRALKALPVFCEPASPELPDSLDDRPDGLRRALERIVRGIAFARWRHDNDEACKTAFTQIVGRLPRTGAERTRRDRPDDEWTLRERLDGLSEMVKTTEPVRSALLQLDTMTEKLAERREQEDRAVRYEKAADAIQELFSLETVVERQVTSLVEELSSETAGWRKKLYSPAFVDAPKVENTDVATDGSLQFSAKAEGTSASARHISNASDLRATLLGFLLAFWQHLLDTRGGLSLLLLDDLQELFDPGNRGNVANTVPEIVAGGGRLIVTTNAPRFGRLVTAAARKGGKSDDLDHRQIHTLSAHRPCIELGFFLEEIEKKKREFEKRENHNEHQPARDYIKALRIYLENRLLDLLDSHDVRLPGKPTFSDLMGAVRARRRDGHDAFTSAVFGRLTSDPALGEHSEFVELMNKSHHSNEENISFNDVWQVRGKCVHVRKLVDQVHEEYQAWLRRDPPEAVLARPRPPQAMAKPTSRVPVVANLAAALSSLSDAGEPTEEMSFDWLDNHAVYANRTRNLGFAAPMRSQLIVELTEKEIPDNSLVVALHREDRVYVRRLLRDTKEPSVVGLSSETENPIDRPPSLLLPAQEVQLLRIVGVLFDADAPHSKSKEEGVLVGDCDCLGRVEIAFRVSGDSALPLALPNQTILGGGQLAPDQIMGHEGQFVAIATTEGTALKRVGAAVPKAEHVRQFEAIGGLGESKVVRTEEIKDDPFTGLPLLVSAREVLGVLYETSG